MTATGIVRLLTPMLLRFLQTRREARERAKREAASLLLWMGEGAYAEARTRARTARAKGDRSNAVLWSRVAVQIAAETGIRIGEKVADRYESPPPKRTPAEREIMSGLVEIAAGIADLARGRADAISVHNLKARVLQLADLRPHAPARAHAAAELCRAAERLAQGGDENRVAFAAGAYPPLAEAAGAALQRFRIILTEKPQ